MEDGAGERDLLKVCSSFWGDFLKGDDEGDELVAVEELGFLVWL